MSVTTAGMTPVEQPLPDEVDVIVIGSGIGGMIAALDARVRGLDVILVEKLDLLGGSSALSGGLMWIPNNPLQAECGVADSREWAEAYLDAVVGDSGPGASPERRAAFIDAGPAVVDFLRRQGVQLERCDGYSDYFTHCPGGIPAGRAVRGVAFDLRRLGPWAGKLQRRTLFPGVPIHMEEVSKVVVAARTGRGAATVGRIAGRAIAARLRGQRIETIGNGLMAALLHALVTRGVPIHTETALVELTGSGERVTGAVLGRPGGQTQGVRAKAVLLTTGGFAQNEAMRKEYGRQPTGTEWTLASRGDTGDGILAGLAVGGTLDNMDEAIWMGVAVRPSGVREMHVFDRAMPHAIVVDSGGSRFVNESIDYMSFGQAIYDRHRSVPAVPCWLIVDSIHRRRYGLGDAPPMFLPPSWLKAGYIRKAATLQELAGRCGIDAGGLERTVARFNPMAVAGRDEDFHRGDTYWDRYFADLTNRPNPCLGPIVAPPFYGVPVYPGDVGTSGGLVTDADARVVTADGAPISGLYAAGNCAASVHGRAYPGPGASIAGSAVFAWRAAEHIARTLAAKEEA